MSEYHKLNIHKRCQELLDSIYVVDLATGLSGLLGLLELPSFEI